LLTSEKQSKVLANLPLEASEKLLSFNIPLEEDGMISKKVDFLNGKV